MQRNEESFEHAWQDFQASRERGECKSLKSYCHAHHIRYEGMRYWKRKNINQHNQAKPRESLETKAGFISIVQDSCSQTSTAVISDVQITCPSGMTVQIGKLPAGILLSILSMQKGDDGCSH